MAVSLWEHKKAKSLSRSQTFYLCVFGVSTNTVELNSTQPDLFKLSMFLLESAQMLLCCFVTPHVMLMFNSMFSSILVLR